MPRHGVLASWIVGVAITATGNARSAQSPRFVGFANGISFPPSCTTSSVQINLGVGQSLTSISITCNGISFNCRPSTLPDAGGAGWAATLKGSPRGTGTAILRCAPAATITGLQTSIIRFHQSFQNFSANDPAQQVTCFRLADRVVASNPSAVFTADEEYLYTCVNAQGGGSAQAVGCFVVDRWSQGVPQTEPRFLRWNAQGTAILVDDCINSLGPGGPLNNPRIFRDGFEADSTREAQTIDFPQPSAQTFSPAGAFRISVTERTGPGPLRILAHEP